MHARKYAWTGVAADEYSNVRHDQNSALHLWASRLVAPRTTVSRELINAARGP